MIARLAYRALRGFGLSRQAARWQTRAAGFEGAAGGRRTRGAGVINSPISAQLAGGRTLARRAEHLVANSGLSRAGVEAWTSALVGCGIKPQSRHPDAATRKLLNAAFDAWTRDADYDGLCDFFGLQAVIARRLVIAGECFAVFTHDDSGALRIRLIDAEQIDDATSDLANGTRIVAGVEFDAAQRRVAYRIYKDRPGLASFGGLQTIRVPFEDMCHIFRVDVPGQVRGVSWFAPVLLRLADLDATCDAQVVRQKIAALLCGFVTDPDGAGGPFTGEVKDGVLEGGLEPGTLKMLQPGQDIRFSEPAELGAESIAFVKFISHEIAAGLGVPFEELTGDRSEGNYSSMRDGKIEFRRRAEALQFNIIAKQFCEPVWRRFVLAEILSGRIDAPDFARDPGAWFAVDWLPPKTDWVDPLRDAQAEILAINAGLMSRRQAVAARGYDLENLDAEIAQDLASANALGLSFDARPQTMKDSAA